MFPVTEPRGRRDRVMVSLSHVQGQALLSTKGETNIADIGRNIMREWTPGHQPHPLVRDKEDPAFKEQLKRDMGGGGHQPVYPVHESVDT